MQMSLALEKLKQIDEVKKCYELTQRTGRTPQRSRVDASGLEKISLHECVQDLKQFTARMRADYAKYPLFILGESMGGAIALRVVSEAPDVVDGLICSVPSGARHKTIGTALKVGTELLFDKTKPIEVGKPVVHQATGSESLRNEWLNDPSARLNLSAEELLQFNN